MLNERLTKHQLQRARTHLVNARALISDPAKWTKGAYARDQNGDPVMVDHPEASCFCSMGALRRAYLSENPSGSPTGLDYNASEALHHWLGTLGNVAVPDVPEFNDSSNHDDVLRMFDGSITLVQDLIKEQAQC